MLIILIYLRDRNGESRWRRRCHSSIIFCIFGMKRMPLKKSEAMSTLLDTWHAQRRFYPKNSEGIAPSAPSSSSPFYPFSESETNTNSIQAYIFPTSFWIWGGATSESGGTCPCLNVEPPFWHGTLWDLKSWLVGIGWIILADRWRHPIVIILAAWLRCNSCSVVGSWSDTSYSSLNVARHVFQRATAVTF